MRFYFAGGAMEVGGSCIYLRCQNYGILLDAGIRQGAGTKDPLPDFRGIQLRGGVDAIVVSHAHMDHTGSLPVISKAYPAAKIYMTRMTMDLTRVLLADSLKLMERREEEIPQYSPSDVSGMIGRIYPMGYQMENEILPGVRLTFYPAGHIAGAACVYLKTPEGAVLYSGDVSGFAQQTIEGIALPRLRPDVLLLESTYGDRLHASRTIEEERFVHIVSECVQEGKKILVPAFALGRAQEVLLLLRKAFQDQKIPPVPVYVDGMIRDMNRMYAANPTYLRGKLAKRIMKGEEPFYTDEIRAVGRTEDRHALTVQKDPAIFIASSGMLMGGPSMLYAKELLGREDSCVLLTGYQDEEAPGRLLLNLLEAKEESEKRITLDGQTIQVRCRVEMVGLSAHADSTQLQGIVEHLGCRRIILEHGSSDAIGALGQVLSEDWHRQVYQPSCGEEIEIIPVKQREQPDRQQELPYVMRHSSFDCEQDPVWLWDYCMQHYPDKAFTANKLFYIWYGTEAGSETETERMAEALLASGWFSRHPKRLFLLRPNTEEERRELLKKKEPSQQDVADFLQKLAGADAVRKFGYYPDRKVATVSFDFPDAVEESLINEWAVQLAEETGWKLEQKGGMNHQAAAALLSSLFGERILKTSYFQERRIYRITLSGSYPEDKGRAEQFRITTGWSLEDVSGVPLEQTCDIGRVTGGSGHSSAEDGLHIEPEAGRDWFWPPEGGSRTEQNLAFSLIDQSFAGSSIKPLRRGRKNDGSGMYLELSFLSPALGRRCSGILEEISRQTGWRIHIADSVNQNAVLLIARRLCEQYDIPLRKNPSYLPMKKCVRIVSVSTLQVPVEMTQRFCEETGIELVIEV